MHCWWAAGVGIATSISDFWAINHSRISHTLSLPHTLFLSTTIQLINNFSLQPTLLPERGKFLALDLGGTNFRVLIIHLKGENEFHMQSKIYAIPQNIMLGTGTQLFDHIAECLSNFMKVSLSCPDWRKNSLQPVHSPPFPLIGKRCVQRTIAIRIHILISIATTWPNERYARQMDERLQLFRCRWWRCGAIT